MRKKNFLWQYEEVSNALSDAVGNGDDTVVVCDKDLDVVLKQFSIMHNKLSKLYYNDEAIFLEAN